MGYRAPSLLSKKEKSEESVRMVQSTRVERALLKKQVVGGCPSHNLNHQLDIPDEEPPQSDLNPSPRHPEKASSVYYDSRTTSNDDVRGHKRKRQRTRRRGKEEGEH